MPTHAATLTSIGTPVFSVVGTEGDGLWGRWTEMPAPAFRLTDGRGDGKREEAMVGEQVVGKV